MPLRVPPHTRRQMLSGSLRLDFEFVAYAFPASRAGGRPTLKLPCIRCPRVRKESACVTTNPRPSRSL